MITQVKLKNFGPLQELAWEELGPINLIIGGNDTGKTFLLKILYSAIRSLEAFQRGNDNRSLKQIVSEKLYWTFQTGKLGDLVTKGGDGSFSLDFKMAKEALSYEFGKEATKSISHIAHASLKGLGSHSIFLPPKEVFSLHKNIMIARFRDMEFGFDDTYVDLAFALLDSPQSEKNYTSFAKSIKKVNNIINGRIHYDPESKNWYFKRGNIKFSIGTTSEGIKKMAVLDRLLSNRYLSPESIVFIDEPEAALHPEAIAKFLDIIVILAKEGMQFFLASHSYFVIKKLYLIAKKENMSIPALCKEEAGWQQHNLLEGLPENRIVNESVRLYMEEVELM